MTTTPLWVPLLVAAIGMAGAVGGTIGGVIITQRSSDKREAIAWERQQQRERDTQAREDAARTFEHRREAYANFFTAHQAMSLLIHDHGLGISTPPGGGRNIAGEPLGGVRSAGYEKDPMPWEEPFPMYDLLQQVQLYGSTPVREAASKAYSVTWQWGAETRFNNDDEEFYAREKASEQAAESLRRAIRRDLSVPDEDDFIAPVE